MEIEETNDFADGKVPEGDRRPLFEIMLNLAGGPICVAALLAGATLAQSLSFWECFVSVVLAGALLTLFGATLGEIGRRTGLSTAMLLRRSFGSGGASLVVLSFVGCLVGWYAVQTSFFGTAINSLFPGGGWLTEPHVAAVWGGLLMLTTALLGYRGLSLLSLVAVPLLIVLCLWGAVSVVGSADLLGYTPRSSLGVGFGVTMVVGALAVGATVTSDVTRYARHPSHPFIACGVGYLLVNSFMMLTGAGTIIATGSGDLLSGMVALGLGVPAVLILILGQWTTNDDNLYSSSLAVLSMRPRWRKSLVVAVLGITATVVAALGAAEYFIPFLIGLGVCIPPVGGVLLADWLILRDGNGQASRFSAPALVAWVSGSLVGFYLPWGIAAVNSTVFAIIIFVMARKVWVNVRR
jgi:cytosine permease